MSTITTAISPTSNDESALRLPKDAQWDVISSKLNTLSLSTVTAPRWLELVDESILLTVIAKLRSELELLHAEAESLEHQCPSSPFNYNIETCTTHDVETCTLVHTLPAQGSSLPMPISLPRLLPRRSHNNNNEDIGETLGRFQANVPLQREQSDSDQSSRPHELSPLGPTFGPRKGLVLSGTVDRRRSVLRYSPTTYQHLPSKSSFRVTPLHTAPLINAERTVPSASTLSTSRMRERRVIRGKVLKTLDVLI